MVSKIEGLDNLTKLTDLSLYSNHIKVIEGLENLTELNVFSFGKNEVTSYENSIERLKGYKNKLQVLNMAENPYHYASQSEKDYKGHTICLLKDLKYLDY
jgi:Leucine-rich repeat (LRR) protein